MDASGGMSAPNSPIAADRTLSKFLASLDLNSKRERCGNNCTGCSTTEKDLGRRLLRCSKCETVLYCSKECQTRNWPVHKGFCGDTTPGKLIGKLVKNLTSSALLHVQLQACLILAFDLLQRPRCDECLIARMDIGIEPCDLADFAEIFLGGGSSKKNVQGMLQLNGITAPMNPGRFAADRQAAWRRAREEADSNGFHDDAIAFVEFIYADAEISACVPVRVASKLKKQVAARIDQGLTLAMTATHELKGHYNDVNCIQCINQTIRADKTNKLLLRTSMRPRDIKIIRDIAAGSDSVPAIILHAKIAREHVYEAIYQMFVERWKAATGVAPSILPPNSNRVVFRPRDENPNVSWRRGLTR
ncbi:hypothetical protein C8F04DRAFT_73693 [Mycena alexandri]|uniref:MYND-type domain-containing protein n=1 Tax=Mycena alexandri TaxID=1745969 RepID=A0AAD6SJC7_9AGAR|nr:hypothetical protein C8F04DRAFT_73693 [Mycena alexandri]